MMLISVTIWCHLSHANSSLFLRNSMSSSHSIHWNKKQMLMQMKKFLTIDIQFKISKTSGKQQKCLLCSWAVFLVSLIFTFKFCALIIHSMHPIFSGIVLNQACTSSRLNKMYEPTPEIYCGLLLLLKIINLDGMQLVDWATSGCLP